MNRTLTRRTFCAGLALAAGGALVGCSQPAPEGVSAPSTDTSDRTAGGGEARPEIKKATPAEERAPRIMLNDGREIPALGLGTYSLTGDVCTESVYAALQRGYRLIDTAYAYHNETEVGQAVRKAVADGVCAREDIVVTTKLYPSQFSNAEAAIEEALGKLDVGAIDLMLLHHPGDGDAAAYRAMEKHVEAGDIGSMGISCYYIEEIAAFLPEVNVKPVLVQNEIHPYYQDRDATRHIQSLGIDVQAWYPLGGRGHQDELLGDPVLAAIAEAHGATIAQVILRWNHQNGVIVIPGSSNPDHMSENMGIFDLELTDDEMSRIAALERREKHDWY